MCHRPLGDRGAGAIEYGSAIVLSGALIACLVVFVPSISTGVGSALCRMLALAGIDCGEEEEPRAEHDVTPAYCPRSSDRSSVGFRADIGFMHIGQEYSFATEELSDGRIMVTSIPGAEAGLSGGAGFDFGDNRNANGSANFEANGTGRLKAGTTFIFDDQAEYEHFKDELHTYVSRENQSLLEYDSGMAVALADTIDPVEIPEPDIVSSTVEVEGNANYGIGLWTSDPDKRSTKNGDYEDKNDGGINLNLGARGNVTVDQKMDISDWRGIGRAETYSWGASGDIGSNVLSNTNADAASWNGATRVMRDDDGKLVNIRYSTVVTTSHTDGTEINGAGGNSGNSNLNENGGKGSDSETVTERSTQMVQLDFDTPEEQAMGERMLEERGLLPPANVLDYSRGVEGDPLSSMVTDSEQPATDPGPDAPDWERHAFEQGRVWQWDSNDEIEANGLEASLKMGLQFGLGANWATEERRTHDAQYLGPPTDDGKREFMPYAPCVAGADD
ncbi:hypothetical protein [Murinocardiopsis flavida]|uniref:hypothetical protein n=1 Tax=Murinocardiopsis flavida TaxID=645275 RepID=UPI000D0CEA62|nr:hypothetical protein [Murinocardiopsis flavida]